MADKEITAAEVTASEKKMKKVIDPYKDTVTIRLPLTREEKDDVAVGVNGRTWLIKRGVSVEVPKCVAEVLRHSEKMLMQSIEYEASAADKSK